MSKFKITKSMLKIKKQIKLFNNNHRGDSIIEVLISITILASVLVSVFVVVNRDLAIETNAHDQTVALNIIQSQLEGLRVDIQKPSFDNYIKFNPNTPFCINFSPISSSNPKIINSLETAGCYFDQNQTYTSSPPTSQNQQYKYKVQITPLPALTLTGSTSTVGYNFKFQVRWAGVGGLPSQINQEILYYRLYLNPTSPPLGSG